MEIEFSNSDLKDLYEGNTKIFRKFKSNPALIKQYIKTVNKLKAVEKIEQLIQFNGLHYEKLKGDLNGLSSVRINLQYRLIFLEVPSTKEPFEIILLELKEISNLPIIDCNLTFKYAVKTIKYHLYMGTNLHECIPAYVIHPGEILKDELNERGIKQNEFAKLTGIQPTQLNEIIKGKRDISIDYALVIGEALSMDYKIWIHLQNNYEIDLAKKNENIKKRNEAIAKWSKVKDFIPISYYKKIKLITGDPIIDIPIISSVWGCDNIEKFESTKNLHFTLFRKSDKLNIERVNLIGWVKYVKYISQQVSVADFDLNKQNYIIDSLKKIFLNNSNVIKKSQTLLAEHGIKLIVEANPDKCPVDGITFWENKNPVIGMSLRHKRLDNFAFTLFHELGHVFLHIVKNENAEFIDIEEENTMTVEKEEKEANEYAKNNLIDKHLWDEFWKLNPNYSETAILDFAQKNKLHPAIVQGRFFYETKNYKIKSNIDRNIH